MTTEPALYLTLEVVQGGASAAADALQAALKAGPVTSLLIRPGADAALAAGTAKSLIIAAQNQGVAALIADDASLARMLKADGVHLSWSKDTIQHYNEARAILGERYAIGADAGRSRDVAIVLGEAGADYIAFGIPQHVEDRSTAEHRQRDLISWWSEIFEIPCVAFDVATSKHAGDLASDGADFIAVSISSAMPCDEVAERVTSFAGAITPAGALA